MLYRIDDLSRFGRAARVAAVSLALVVVLPVFADVNTINIDLEPPALDHVSLDSGIAGDPQSIAIVVTDDTGIERVTLLSCAAGQQDYSSTLMRAMDGQARLSAQGVQALVALFQVVRPILVWVEGDVASDHVVVVKVER